MNNAEGEICQRALHQWESGQAMCILPAEGVGAYPITCGIKSALPAGLVKARG